MKVITKHLTKEILQATGFVLLALVALFAFFDLVGQLGRIGSRYGLLDAFVITGLSLPMRIYEVMPIAALLGTVFVMSQWASRSEFTILRVAGLSPVRLAAILMVPGIILVAFTYAFGEFIAPFRLRILIRVSIAQLFSIRQWISEDRIQEPGFVKRSTLPMVLRFAISISKK